MTSATTTMPQTSAELREMVERATPEQRLALAKAGITLAVLQEKLRMGFTNEEVATVLATDESDEVITEAYELWRQRLEQLTETHKGEGGLNDEGGIGEERRRTARRSRRASTRRARLSTRASKRPKR